MDAPGFAPTSNSAAVSSKFCMFVGLTMASSCAWSMYDVHTQNSTYYWIGFFLGSFLFTIFLLCCPGAYRESKCFLWTFIALLLFLITVQIVVLSKFHTSNFIKINTDMVEALWKKEVEKPGPMAEMEQEYKCCGLHNWSDYTAHNLTIPNSCYPNNDAGNVTKIFTEGCFESLASVAEQVVGSAKWLNWILIVIELVAFAFTCVLCRYHGDYATLD